MNDPKQILSIKHGYVSVERQPEYEVVLSDQSARMMEISALCDQAECRKVLVVGHRTKVKLSTMGVFSLGEMVAHLNLQVAVVEMHNAPDENVKFLENVTTNRGGQIQFFDNEQDAKDWLGVE